jgi:hypothetical protein
MCRPVGGYAGITLNRRGQKIDYQTAQPLKFSLHWPGFISHHHGG